MNMIYLPNANKATDAERMIHQSKKQRILAGISYLILTYSYVGLITLIYLLYFIPSGFPVLKPKILIGIILLVKIAIVAFDLEGKLLTSRLMHLACQKKVTYDLLSKSKGKFKGHMHNLIYVLIAIIALSFF
ncbi:hypothetical protein C9J21_19955 [Photobacterium phosphoreum]|uniref:hypothetical protein n=1 Tax=Photobacterium phosphoreum TaxID=659 RepID=UPI000D1721C3|nr:hypothetical protein [Photobacterium phosphoreum]PSW29163.1 hypothetical protein C9J21_19955 [Photobacterium phosphoreum]